MSDQAPPTMLAGQKHKVSSTEKKETKFQNLVNGREL